jgi:rhodanese-related sulfurtransferase
MYYTVKQIMSLDKGKTCIHVSTFVEWKEICKLFSLKLNDSHYDCYIENSVIYPLQGLYGSIAHAKGQSYTIIEYGEIINPPNTRIGVFCRTEEESKAAVNTLIQLGYKNPGNLEGTVARVYYSINSSGNIDGGTKRPDGVIILTLEELLKLAGTPDTEDKRKIIGYKAPFDLWREGVKAGSIFKKVSSASSSYKTDDTGFTEYSRHLPAEIVEKWEPVYEEVLKVGDWVMHKNPSLSSFWAYAFPAAKIEGKYLYKAGGANQYVTDFRLATDEEIQQAKNNSRVSIGGYDMEVKTNAAGVPYVAFGCQSFTLDEVRAFNRLLVSSEFKGSISINGEEISREIIGKIYNQLMQ